jgi:alpha-methylacyl-CoA racemase
VGPLNGIRIVEIAGIGPGQFCGMLLADMGASVLRIDRLESTDLGVAMPPRYNLMNRSRPVVPLDLRRPEGVELVLDLCAGADALFEGFRPGVMERLGLGPEQCMARNPRLVYGRMTGWGQDGPLAERAGHDPNYIALAGVLGSIGERGGPPVYPLNLVGDFGGGGAYMALGLLAGILEASRSGQGQVVDAAMVDGAASLMTLFHGLAAAGLWKDERGSNVLDGGAPFLRPYETADGGHVVVGALEGRFFRELLDRLGIDDLDPAWQYDRRRWPEIERRLAEVFRSRTRAEWVEAFEGSDACCAPVLSLTEATRHPHNVARGTYVEVDGIVQPAPAPRFSRTPSAAPRPPASAGTGAASALAEWNVPAERVSALCAAGVLRVGPE